MTKRVMEKDGFTNSPNRRSFGVKLLASLEILLGLFGMIYFFLLLFGYLVSFSSKSAEAEMGREIATVIGITLLPSFLLFISGIGIFKLKHWAWKANIFVVPLSFLIVYLYWVMGRIDYSIFLLPFILLCILVGFQIVLLTTPKVKEQFKIT